MSAHLVLFNPGARRGARIARAVRELTAAFAPGETPLSFVAISDLDQVREVPQRLIVIGGDGTVSRAAEWLSERGAHCPLALVPAGTGNNLARGLRLPLDPKLAFRLALRGSRCRLLDAIACSTPGEPRRRLFLQSAALGFPAEIADRFDTLRRRPLLRFLFAPMGPYVYRILALSGLGARKRKEKRGEELLRARVRLPGEELSETVLAIFLGNEESLGGNFHPCPRAEVDDGLLDLCLVRAGTGASYLKTFQRVVRGRHLALEDMVLYRQTRGPAEIELSEPALLLADGDLRARSNHFRFEVLPRRFEVVVE